MPAGEFEEGRKHGRGRQRKCPAVKEAIDDGNKAVRALEHIRKGMTQRQQPRGAARKREADASVAGRRLWRPVGTAFVSSAKAAGAQGLAALDAVISDAAPDGVPDTRSSLFALLGMGPLVHEGWWVADAAVGGTANHDATFYRELRDGLGLARWECGRLVDSN
jgi:hypothetical protein